MKNILKLYGKDFLAAQEEKLKKGHDKLAYILTAPNPGAQIYLQEFEKYLEFGEEHNALDPQIQGRLKKSYESFFQARNELMGGYFFSTRMGFKISYKPEGRNKKIGEFLIKTNNYEQIFVEMKSPIREAPGQVWSGLNFSTVKESIKYAVEKLKPNCKNLIVFSGQMEIAISEPVLMISALYGETFLSVNLKTQELKEGFAPSGIFQPKINTRISAVAALAVSINADNELFYSFQVYHNPYARNPISHELFNDWPQFIKKENIMEWINRPHSF